MKNNLGISSVRVDVNEEYVTSAGQGTYDWTQYDQLVADIRAAGLSIDFLLDGNPQWEGNGSMDAPLNPTVFAAWAQAVAQRYGSGGPSEYEIANEPNITEFWTTPNAAAYTAVLKAAFTSIRSVQPSAAVISAGLAPTSTDSSGDINAVTFLQSMYAAGAKNYMTAVGYHPYSYEALPGSYESWSGFSQLSATSPSIRSVMTANGDSGKQVWLTEVGWPTNETALTGQTGQAAQAAELQQVVSFAKANTWVGPVYWYTYQDNSALSGNEANFGVITASGVDKAGYAAMANR